MTALGIAAMVGASEVVRLLLEKGAQIDSPDDAGKTALIQAAGHQFPGSEATVALLLKNGANPKLKDHDGNTALSEARRRGSAGIVALLEKRGAP
jgi:ankyrin repeat protein